MSCKDRVGNKKIDMIIIGQTVIDTPDTCEHTSVTEVNNILYRSC